MVTAFCVFAASGQGVARSVAVGDVILADGTIAKVEKLSSLDRANLPIAVVAAVKKGGLVALGVHRSAECLRFEAQLKGEKTASDFAAEYAVAHHIRGGYAAGWRLPDLDELKTIYANRAAINATLQKVYRLDNAAAMNGLGNAWYWAGTPAAKKGFAWFVHFFNGYAGECERDLTNLNAIAVCDVRE